MAVLLAACATAGEPVDEHDAGPKDPLPPDAMSASEPYSTTLYLRGSFNDFGLSSPLTHQGNNQYTAVVSLGVGSHELKIADERYTVDTSFAMAADRAMAIELDVPTGLVQSAGMDNGILLFVPQPGAYRFELSATDRAAPVLLISLASPAPYRDTLYVRGSFNDFDTSAPMEYEGDARYGATLALEAGTHRFKIANQSFSDSTTFSLSATEAASLALDTPASLVIAPGTDNDTVLELTQAGSYRFELFASNVDVPVLQVSPVSLTRGDAPAAP
jgi:pullulanase